MLILQTTGHTVAQAAVAQSVVDLQWSAESDSIERCMRHAAKACYLSPGWLRARQLWYITIRGVRRMVGVRLTSWRTAKGSSPPGGALFF